MFRCKKCGKGFRYSSFKLSYREKKPGINSKIFELFTTGASNRHMGRIIGVSEHCIRGRLKKLAQWTLMKHAQLTRDLKIEEPIVYDGLEAFAKSQYDPNQIQQAIGKSSYFIYDFNFVPLNRKGRMTRAQKQIRADIEKEKGRYHPKAIRIATKELFSRLYERRSSPQDALTIYSDEHFQYERAIRRDLRGCKITHFQTSSKDTRNYQNNLFAVNHADLLTRQHIAAFRRETISFSKKHERMIQKFILFLGWKNYFRPIFVKPHKRRKERNTRTPAMEVGICSKILKFHEFFDLRLTPKQVPLNREWDCFYHEKPTYSRIPPAIAA